MEGSVAYIYQCHQNGAIMVTMRKAVSKKQQPPVGRFTLRLPPDMVKAIEAECARRAGKVSRNTWIAEAVQEKLERAKTAARQSKRAKEGG